MVAGLDGSAAFEGRVKGLSSASDRDLFRVLRALADVVLVGAGTVRAERYGPARLTEEQRADRLADGRPALPPIAVVSRSLDLDWGSPLFADDAEVRPIVITADAAGDALIERARAHSDVIVAGGASVDLGLALRELGRRGATCVLTEGGPFLLGGLVAGGLLDELCLTLAPMAGGDALPIVERAGGRALVPFRLASVAEQEGQLFLRYLTGPA